MPDSTRSHRKLAFAFIFCLVFILGLGIGMLATSQSLSAQKVKLQETMTLLQASQQESSDLVIENQKLKAENQKLKESSTSLNPVSDHTPDTQPQGNTVYITESGHKYHKDGCRYLSKSRIPIALEDAQAQGYSPCSRCH